MNQTTQALQTIADLRTVNRELQARVEFLENERDRYEKTLRDIRGENSGVWGRMADEALRGAVPIVYGSSPRRATTAKRRSVDDWDRDQARKIIAALDAAGARSREDTVALAEVLAMLDAMDRTAGASDLDPHEERGWRLAVSGMRARLRGRSREDTVTLAEALREAVELIEATWPKSYANQTFRIRVLDDARAALARFGAARADNG